jgi:hypothetical protein
VARQATGALAGCSPPLPTDASGEFEQDDTHPADSTTMTTDLLAVVAE